jgi:hypothetical protein
MAPVANPTVERIQNSPRWLTAQPLLRAGAGALDAAVDAGAEVGGAAEDVSSSSNGSAGGFGLELVTTRGGRFPPPGVIRSAAAGAADPTSRRSARARIGRILPVLTFFAMRTLWIAALAIVSCTQTPAPGPKKKPPKDPAAMSGWHQLSLPVQNGRKIPCAKMLPDEAAFNTALGPALATGKKVTISEDGPSDADATTVCSVKLAGKPPSAAEQKAAFDQHDRMLGVLPGDEVCSIHVFCWYAFDAPGMKHECEDKHFTGSTEIGDYTCVQHMNAGDNQRAIVSALDPDTRCKMVVHAGPSEFDDNLVKACTKASVDLIGPPQIAP